MPKAESVHSTSRRRARCPKVQTAKLTGITPEQCSEAWSRKEREALIDLLIDSLNEIDGDPDLEDDGDGEPSLASADAFNPTSQEHWTQGNSDEREGDDGDDREYVC